MPRRPTPADPGPDPEITALSPDEIAAAVARDIDALTHELGGGTDPYGRPAAPAPRPASAAPAPPSTASPPGTPTPDPGPEPDPPGSAPLDFTIGKAPDGPEVRAVGVCLMCDAPASLVGIYVPDRETSDRLGARPGQHRCVAYFLCGGCARDLPAAMKRVEATALATAVAELGDPEAN
jgi:hypothetical protein